MWLTVVYKTVLLISLVLIEIEKVSKHHSIDFFLNDLKAKFRQWVFLEHCLRCLRPVVEEALDSVPGSDSRFQLSVMRFAGGRAMGQMADPCHSCGRLGWITFPVLGSGLGLVSTTEAIWGVKQKTEITCLLVCQII